MTAFRSYPQRRVTLPADGKVTGSFVLIFRGDGSALARTEGAHINDDNPAVDFRGESWLTHMELIRDQKTGAVAFPETYGSRSPFGGGITRRQNWSPAPATYAATIAEAMRAAAEDTWTDADDADGRDADARQRLSSLEREAAELADKLKSVRADIRRQSRRLMTGAES